MIPARPAHVGRTLVARSTRGDGEEFTASQKRALAVATVVALAFGAYFLRGYFILIVVGAVAAYLFDPLFDWFQTRFGKGLSVTLTVLAALLMVVIPVSLLVLLAVVQISAMVRSVSGWVSRTDLSSLGDRTLDSINDVIDRVPFLTGVDVTPELLRDRMTRGRAEGRRIPAALSAGRRGRPGRRRHRCGALPLRLHLAAHQPRARADC